MWNRDNILYTSTELYIRRGRPDLSYYKWNCIFPALKLPVKYILHWLIMLWFMLWYALWYYNVLLPLCLIFSPLINFSGYVVSERGYLPKVPMEERGILPAVCCLREGILCIFFPLPNLTAFFFLYLSSLFWNSINKGDIFTQKITGRKHISLSLVHTHTC